MSWTDIRLWEDTLYVMKVIFVDSGLIYPISIFYTVLFYVSYKDRKSKKYGLKT